MKLVAVSFSKSCVLFFANKPALPAPAQVCKQSARVYPFPARAFAVHKDVLTLHTEEDMFRFAVLTTSSPTCSALRAPSLTLLTHHLWAVAVNRRFSAVLSTICRVLA